MSHVWPDIENVIAGLLRAAEVAEHIGTDLPPNLRYRMPLVLVERRGGTGSSWLDSPVVLVDVLSSRPGVAKTLSNSIRDLLTGDPLALWPIDRATVVAGPQEIPHGDSGVLRWTTTYEVETRRVAAA